MWRANMAEGGNVDWTLDNEDDNVLVMNLDGDDKENDVPNVENEEADNGNEAKQVKRRGRPPKVRNNSENPTDYDPKRTREYVALKEELDQMKRENKDLKAKLRNNDALLGCLENDIDVAKGLLIEKEHDYENLLKEFANQPEAVKPSGLIIHDNCSVEIAKKLESDKIDWNLEMHRVNDLHRISMEDIAIFDIIVLLTGTTDILENRGAGSVFSDVLTAAERFAKHCTTYCVSLPPNSPKSVQVNLFNHKLGELNSEDQSFQIINITPKGLRSSLLRGDGITPSDKCVTAFTDDLKTQISATKIRPRNKEVTAGDFEVKAFLPLKQEVIGKVIGKGGNVIKKITDDTGVQMTIGKWTESSGRGRDDKDSAMDGVLISGLTGRVREAIATVSDITSVNKDYEPNEKKRKM